MYSLRDYGKMIADEDRFNAYRRSIEHAVRAGDIVLEIGCGPGLFALLACQAGAKKVYAIESEEVAHFARELAACNSLADRIQFIQSDSRKVDLPERVNVIVSDIRGVLPLYDHTIASIEDARKRFLVPGGTLIPQRDTLKAAVVEISEYYCGLVSPWHSPLCGLNLTPSVKLVVNCTYTAHLNCEQVLSEPLAWADLNYSEGVSPNATAELVFHALRPGTAHGVCVWFDTQLMEGIGYSTAPGAENSVYGQIFLPWLEAVPVAQGQEIHVRLQANLVGSDYVWRWETRIPANGSRPERHFEQSTLQGAILSPESLRRRAADFVPTLSEAGQADRWLLQAMNGQTSLQQMAREAAQRFPKVFPRWQDALTRAADLAAQFSR